MSHLWHLSLKSTSGFKNRSTHQLEPETKKNSRNSALAVDRPTKASQSDAAWTRSRQRVESWEFHGNVKARHNNGGESVHGGL